MSEKQVVNAMNLDQLVEFINNWYSSDAPRRAADMLIRQQKEISELVIALKNVWKIVENREVEIEALKAHYCKGNEGEGDFKKLSRKELIDYIEYLRGCLG